MTELMRLIQAHLDRYGVSQAEFARRAGTTPQTVNNWRHRLKTMPDAKHLRGIAEVIGVPYVVVLDAALADAGYRDSAVDSGATIEARMRRAAEADPAVVEELWFAINRLKAERDIAASRPVEPSVAADLLTRILRQQQAGAGDLPMAARTEDDPKED